MQIPYDLEFVENRPTVRAMAMEETFPGWRRGRSKKEKDVFDLFLRWAHRMLRRFEDSSR